MKPCSFVPEDPFFVAVLDGNMSAPVEGCGRGRVGGWMGVGAWDEGRDGMVVWTAVGVVLHGGVVVVGGVRGRDRKGVSLDGAGRFGLSLLGRWTWNPVHPCNACMCHLHFSCLACVSYLTFLVFVYSPPSFRKDPFPTNNLFNPAERGVNLLRKVSRG